MHTGTTGRLRSLDICSGAGGLAVGLEESGFDPVLLLDNRDVACRTLRTNRPSWNVLETNLLDFDPSEHTETYDVDLLSAGLPRVKATATIARRDSEAELELLRATMLLLHGVQPRALLVENVPDLVTKPAYEAIRSYVAEELSHLGYRHAWFVVNAADFGVPQTRRQGILVAFKGDVLDAFVAPTPTTDPHRTVGEALLESMSAGGWPEAGTWAAQANQPAPTLVGGSWERGGADLGPTGSKRAWARIGVDGATVADAVPDAAFRWDPTLGRVGMMPLTVDQAALLQGFPPSWRIEGRKTAKYRQVGHASPPPVGCVLGKAIAAALRA
ncbi:DNA cytosine methyltransferase [Streptomyces sp. NBC_01294]|uniref:DNA cytosine methyltransferase n=1 Tax=Streptomyces sp. NBC_01294 TaxID=2903815 RepID=UPI002DDC4F5F|nr:DNA cytosine methyltransferase [Streptomyces sp. NBC_01294]WRZ59134.1 DNA cytosine methyltransferase [Streptomyces sp. NBC_01294]